MATQNIPAQNTQAPGQGNSINWRRYAAIGAGAIGLLSLGFCARDCRNKNTPNYVQAVVANDFPMSSYKNLTGERSHFYVIETSDGKHTMTYRLEGNESAVNSASRRVRKGDKVKFLDGDISTLEITEPYIAGEIPFGRNLVVEGYEIEKLRNFTNPDTVDDVVATVSAVFSAGNETESYTLKITGISESDAEMTVKNLKRYNVLAINKQDDNGGRGVRGGRVTVKPTERGLEIYAPSDRINWSDDYPYEVRGHKPRSKVLITP